MLYACELLEEATTGLKMLACQSLSHMNPSSVMLSCQPGGHKRNTPLFFLLLLSLLLLCLKSQDLYMCMLLLYLQNASAHADKVCVCPMGQL